MNRITPFFVLTLLLCALTYFVLSQPVQAATTNSQVCVDDMFEPNNSLSTAAALSFSSTNNLVACGMPGTDVFQFNVPSGTVASMTITFTTGTTPANIMLNVYGSSLSAVASSHFFTIPASATQVENITSVALTDISTTIVLSYDNEFQYELELAIDNQSPSLTSASFNVSQTAANGTPVGTVVGTDPDGDVLSYSIVGGNLGGAFTINPTTGVISVANNSGFATTSFYNLAVRVTDPGGLTATANVSVSIISPPMTSIYLPILMR